MPICDGYEFLERIQGDSLLSSIPVIVMTASSRQETELKCLELGAVDFVIKPFYMVWITYPLRKRIPFIQAQTLPISGLFHG